MRPVSVRASVNRAGSPATPAWRRIGHGFHASTRTTLPARVCYLYEYWRGKSGSTGLFLADYFVELRNHESFWVRALRTVAGCAPGILEFWRSTFCHPPQKRGENSTNQWSAATGPPPKLWRTTFPRRGMVKS